jgi:hypothetical protein
MNTRPQHVIDTIANPDARVIHLSAARAARKAVLRHLFDRAVRQADDDAARAARSRNADAKRAAFFIVQNS